MPKIVDHEKYRLELAGRAVAIFSEFGYSGLGMRQIAERLGISKSALYHYFSTKEALFAACTEVATSFEGVMEEQMDLKDAPPRERLKVLAQIFKDLEDGFPGELSLLVDYLRGKTPADTAKDKNMRLANKRYLELVTQFVDEKDAMPVLCMMLGLLLQRFFDGGSTDWSIIEDWLGEKLNEPDTMRSRLD